MLVGTIAVVVYLNVFPPTFHGWGEAVVETRSIAGWAVNDAAPWDRVEVQLFIDGKLYGAQVAQAIASGRGCCRMGQRRVAWLQLHVTVVAGRESRSASLCGAARVARRLTLQLLGDPITFRSGCRWQ